MHFGNDQMKKTGGDGETRTRDCAGRNLARVADVSGRTRGFKSLHPRTVRVSSCLAIHNEFIGVRSGLGVWENTGASNHQAWFLCPNLVSYWTTVPQK